MTTTLHAKSLLNPTHQHCRKVEPGYGIPPHHNLASDSQAVGSRYYVNNHFANRLLAYLHDFSERPAYAGGPGYAIPSHIKSILDQLKELAEELGVKDALAEGTAAGTAPEDSTDPQGRSKKPQKQLPTQLNPLLAKLARHAATENDKVPGEGGHPVLFPCLAVNAYSSCLLSDIQLRDNLSLLLVSCVF